MRKIRRARATIRLLLGVTAAAAAASPGAGRAQVTGPDSGRRDQPNPTHTVPPVDSAGRRDPLRIELGVMPHYINNYFQAQDDFNSGITETEKRNVYETTLSASADYDIFHRPNSTLTAGVRVRRHLFSDLDGADSTDLDGTLTYDFRPNQLRFRVFHTPRRLASIVNDRNVYGETTGFSGDYLRQVNSRLRLRAGYQFARETFSEFNERDVSRHQFEGDVRWQVDPLFSPGVGVEYLRGDAETPNFSYDRPALLLFANSRVADVAYLTFRLRLSRREFDTEVPTDSNFDRVDKRGDATFYGTYQLGGGFSLFSFGSYTDNDSNREARDFTAYEAGLGLFYRF